MRGFFLNRRNRVIFSIFAAVLLILLSAGFVGAKRGWFKYFADTTLEARSLNVNIVDIKTHLPLKDILFDIYTKNDSGKLIPSGARKEMLGGGAQWIFHDLNPGEYYLSHMPCADEINQKVTVAAAGTSYVYALDPSVDCSCRFYHPTDITGFSCADGGIKVYMGLKSGIDASKFVDGINVYMTDSTNATVGQLSTAKQSGSTFNGTFTASKSEDYKAGRYRFYINRKPTDEVQIDTAYEAAYIDEDVTDQFHGAKRFEFYAQINPINSLVKVNVDGVIRKGPNKNCPVSSDDTTLKPVNGVRVSLKSKTTGVVYFDTTANSGEAAPGPTSPDPGPTTMSGHSLTEISSGTAPGSPITTNTSQFGRSTDPATGEPYGPGVPYSDKDNNGLKQYDNSQIPSGWDIKNPDDSYAAVRGDKNKDAWWWNKGKRYLKVANKSNGKAVIVTVQDWGPRADLSRDIDLSHAAYKYLGLEDSGTEEGKQKVQVTFAETSKEDGYYKIGNIPRDVYEVKLEKDGFTTNIVGELDLTAKKADSTTKQDGLIYELKNLEQSFTGSVLNMKGEAINGVKLDLMSVASGKTIASGSTDKTGTYLIKTSGLVIGVDNLSLKYSYESEEGLLEGFYPAPINPPAVCQTMALAPIKIDTGIKIKISGTVTDSETKKPLKSTKVSIESKDGAEKSKSAITGDDGKYKLFVNGGKDYIMLAKYCGADIAKCDPPMGEAHSEVNYELTKVIVDQTVDFQLTANPNRFSGRFEGYVYDDVTKNALKTNDSGDPTVFLYQDSEIIGRSATNDYGKYSITLRSNPGSDSSGYKYKVCVRDRRYQSNVDNLKNEMWSLFSDLAGSDLQDMLNSAKFNDCKDATISKNTTVVRKDFYLKSPVSTPTNQEYSVQLKYQLIDSSGNPIKNGDGKDENGSIIPSNGVLAGVKAKIITPNTPDGQSGAQESYIATSDDNGKLKLKGTKISSIDIVSPLSFGMIKKEINITKSGNSVIVLVKALPFETGKDYLKNEAAEYTQPQNDPRWGSEGFGNFAPTTYSEWGCGASSFSMFANWLKKDPNFMTPPRLIQTGPDAIKNHAELLDLVEHFKALFPGRVKQAGSIQEMADVINANNSGGVIHFNKPQNGHGPQHAVLALHLENLGNNRWRANVIDPGTIYGGHLVNGNTDPKTGYNPNYIFSTDQVNKAWYATPSNVKVNQVNLTVGTNGRITGRVPNLSAAASYPAFISVTAPSNNFNWIPSNLVNRAFAATSDKTTYNIPLHLAADGSFLVDIPAFMVSPGMEVKLVEQYVIFPNIEYPIIVNIKGSVSTLSMVDKLRVKRGEILYNISTNTVVEKVKQLVTNLNDWVRRTFMLATDQGMFSANVTDANGDQISNAQVFINDIKLTPQSGFYARKFKAGIYKLTVKSFSGQALYQKEGESGHLSRQIEINRGEDNYFGIQLNEVISYKADQDRTKGQLSIGAVYGSSSPLPVPVPITVKTFEIGTPTKLLSEKNYFSDQSGYLFVEDDFIGTNKAGQPLKNGDKYVTVKYCNKETPAIYFFADTISSRRQKLVFDGSCSSEFLASLKVNGEARDGKLAIFDSGSNLLFENDVKNGQVTIPKLFYPAAYNFVFKTNGGEVYRPQTSPIARVTIDGSGFRVPYDFSLATSFNDPSHHLVFDCLYP